jgi:hypothetical protein
VIAELFAAEGANAAICACKIGCAALLSDEPEAFDLRLRLREVGAFGRERPDHPLQRLHIVVWQITKIDGHELEVYADSRASFPIRMPVSQSAAVIIRPRPVATAARVRASRRRQSASTTAPSSASAPTWADVRRPEKYAVLEPLGEEAEAGAISEHNFDKAGLPTREHEAMAG